MTALIVILGLAGFLISIALIFRRMKRLESDESSIDPASPATQATPKIIVTETKIERGAEPDERYPILGEFRRGLLIEVVGESRINDDGTNRQDILANSSEGDHVELVREPENEHDQNAIRVDLLGGTVGYVKRALAAELAPALDAGIELDAAISRLAGGTPDKPSIGIWVRAYLK